MSTEFAPGIPFEKTRHPVRSVKGPETWEFGLHRHLAKKAGPHYDIRLGDPDTGHAHSFAMRKEWPKPGEVRLVIPQPTHTIPYMDFEGYLPPGYGEGKVELPRREKAEITSSSPTHVRFNLYSGKSSEEYLLHETPKGWLLHNITTVRGKGAGTELPDYKPKFKEVDPQELDPKKENKVWQAKVDGAHVVYQFRDSGDQARVFSYRPTKRETGAIEHTHKLPDFHDLRTPPALKNSLLRGELIATDARGRALGSTDIGGILNSSVWKSREKQDDMGKLVPYVFDVVKWKGKNVEDAPFSEKQKMLEEAVKEAPWLKLPRTATTPDEKAKLYSDIHKHHEPSTQEGLVEWDVNKPEPVKAKFKQDQDVYIREIFPETGKKRHGLAGGFAYSLTPKGEIAGRVGTGFSHEMKKDMLERPQLYVGLKARMETARGHAGRQPSFMGLHLDQDLPEGVKIAEGETEMSTTGQFSGSTLNPAGQLMDGIARKTDQWKPATQGPPKVQEKTAMKPKLAEGQVWMPYPAQQHQQQENYGQLPPITGTGRLVGAVRRARSNPSMLMAQLMASNLLSSGPKLAAVAVAAFGDELRKLREGM